MAGAAASRYPNPGDCPVGVRKMLRFVSRKALGRLALVITLSLFATPKAFAQARDVAGAKDFPHRPLRRQRHHRLSGEGFRRRADARSPLPERQAGDARRLEGRITRIAYRTNPGPSMLEVARNFETQLGKAGFEKLFACDADACGGIPFTEAVDTLPCRRCGSTASTSLFRGPQGRWRRETYASVLVSENNKDITAQLIVAELGAIEDKMVNAAQMAKGLGETGHIALYGIYFDTDKAVLKPKAARPLSRSPSCSQASRSSTSSSSATPTTRAL